MKVSQVLTSIGVKLWVPAAPTVIAVESLTGQYDKVAEMVRGWIDAGTLPETIGLLVPTCKEAEALPRASGDRDVTVAFVDATMPGRPRRRWS